MNSYKFDFDLGISGRGSGASRPLRDQKQLNSSSSSSAPPKSAAAPQQPSKPSWIHQPSPQRSNAPSMAGDILGKSWGTPPPPTSSRASAIGIPDSSPNLFGDLLGSALGSHSKNTNVPLKSSLIHRNSHSTGSLADSSSIPKSASSAAAPQNPPINKPTWGSSDNLTANYFSTSSSSSSAAIKTPNPPMKSSANPKRDPFESLVELGSKNYGNPPISSAKAPNSSPPDLSFGDFQNAKVDDHSYGVFQDAKINSFAMPPQTFSSPPPPPPQPQPQDDPLDGLFSSSAATAPSGGPAFSEANDWDLGSEFGGNNDAGGGATTEFEGLPPPPAGVTPSAAKGKGFDSYKQGQYADAIKWLSWAVVLFDKLGDVPGTVEILSCRASCYKEVGEYKKAVADCSKVLEHDSKNVSVLVQRALLYESTEKYRLGTEDLRLVLKIDPANRVARSTIHRLSQLAD